MVVAAWAPIVHLFFGAGAGFKNRRQACGENSPRLNGAIKNFMVFQR
jgi:hypothetical protein